MSYQASPFAPSYGLQVGIPGYSFGSWNSGVAATSGFLTNVALASNVATVNLTIQNGAIPTTGSLISILGVTPAAFNVTNTALTGVTGFNTGDNSTGTVTFALSLGPYTLSAAGNASGGHTTYTGSGLPTSGLTGLTATISGFVTNPTNNGSFVIVSSTTTTLVVVNSSGIAETHAASAAISFSSAPASGQFIIPVPEVAVPLSVAAGQQFAIPVAASAGLNGGREVSWSYSCPSAPSTISIQLEGAIRDVASEYTIIGTALTTAAGAAQFETVPSNIRFLRLNVTATTGGSSPTIIGKILI
jgi:hypothetical protein